MANGAVVFQRYFGGWVTARKASKAIPSLKKMVTSKISRDKGSLFGDLCSCNLHSGDGGMLLWKRVNPPQDQDVWTSWCLPFYVLFLCFPSCLMFWIVQELKGTNSWSKQSNHGQLICCFPSTLILAPMIFGPKKPCVSINVDQLLVSWILVS